MQEKIVYQVGAWQIKRCEAGLTRTSTNSPSWEVWFDGKFYASVIRKKDGVKMIAGATA